MKLPSIFISYRRSDAEGWAGRLSDSLRARLGHITIFRDIEEIPPGVDFVDYFTKAVGECDAFIELIGPGWLNATDASGRRRLDDPSDCTRLELATALKRNIRVIPVLLQGAAMPSAGDLPEDLQALARRNAYPVSDSRWNEDTKKLAEILREIVTPPQRQQRVFFVTVAVALIVVIAIVLAYREDGDRTTAPTASTDISQPPISEGKTGAATPPPPSTAIKPRVESVVREAEANVAVPKETPAVKAVKSDDPKASYTRMDFGFNGCNVQFDELKTGVTEAEMVRLATAAGARGFTYHPSLLYGRVVIGEYPEGCRSAANLSWPLYLKVD